MSEERQLAARLYAEYEQAMYRTAFGVLKNSYDAEDAVHEAFLGIIKGGMLSRLTDAGSSGTKAYILTAARNAAINILNKRKRTVAVEAFDDVATASAEETVLSAAGVGEIKAALLALPKGDYEILCLSLVGGASGEETAAVLGISYDAARQRIHRARMRLAKILSEGVAKNDK
ncbi:MAG: sigma-70 family RNA polymerase sigma factor [Eubacterium sp.]|nr:sigma-70 family RNA polymerase sigma factor [Eubacterium sp.]